MTKIVENSNSKISEKEKLRLLKEENKRLKVKRDRLIIELILIRTSLLIINKNKISYAELNSLP